MDSTLRSLDIAALATLRLVHRRGSFTAAAAELGLKQSTVSYTIDRLRRAFSDPLFVRQGGGIATTDRCLEILASVDRILGELERAALPAEFDPATTTASVTILATYLSRSALMPTVLRDLRHEAPGLSVEFITGFTDTREYLLSGRADLALTPVELDDSGIYRTVIAKDSYVCLMDPGNPLAQKDLTTADFEAASHLVIHYGQRWRPLFHDAPEAKGLSIRAAVNTPDPEDVRFLLPGTDLIVALPSLIARQFRDGLHMCPCPIPSRTEVKMYWPARLNHAPLQDWLRKKIIQSGRPFMGC